MKCKTYKIKGLDIFIINCLGKSHAISVCQKLRIGITGDNLIEVSEVSNNSEIIDAVWELRIDFQDFSNHMIYNPNTNDYTMDHILSEELMGI